MKVQLLRDPATGVLKPLLVNGKVATSADCCCTPNPCTIPPSGDCIYYVNFNFKIDSSESGLDNEGDFFQLNRSNGAAGVRLFYFFDGGTFFWESYTATASNEADSGFSAGQFFDTFHSCTVIVHRDTHIATICIDGAFIADIAIDNFTPGQLILGAVSPGAIASRRSFANVQLVMGDDTFDFPGDSFSSLIGGASAGSTLEINQGSGDAYGQRDLVTTDTVKCNGTCACPPSGDLPTNISILGHYTVTNAPASPLAVSASGLIAWLTDAGDCVGRVSSQFSIDVNCNDDSTETLHFRLVAQIVVEAQNATTCEVSLWTLQGAIQRLDHSSTVCGAPSTGLDCATSDTGFTPATILGAHVYDCVGPDPCPNCPGTPGHSADWTITVS